MVEIHPNLHIGKGSDFETELALPDNKVKPGWYVVHAAKDPWHRKTLGYTGRSAPKDSPEYLCAFRENQLALNFIDGVPAQYIPVSMVMTGLATIVTALRSGQKVLVHCNLGQSRAPTLGLLYLAMHTTKLPEDLKQALVAYREIYPSYEPAAGLKAWVESHWYRLLTLKPEPYKPVFAYSIDKPASFDIGSGEAQ